ncbi:MAG: helix-turn-helix domain-containing protein [Bacillota bacterium]
MSQESQKSSSKYFTVPLSRIEMAEYLCVDRCALTRELSRMKAEGILDYSNNTFRLL